MLNHIWKLFYIIMQEKSNLNISKK